MPSLVTLEPQRVRQLTRTRPLETKLGEMVQTEAFTGSGVRYVVVGIPEDIGVRANLGLGGAHTAWPAFLEAFLNVQATDELAGQQVCVLGHVDCSDLAASGQSVQQLRQAVSAIDEAVEQTIYEICAAGKIPVVVGGGHNNAYPIIRAAARSRQNLAPDQPQKVNCINLDAHSDFRKAEGRHSGNGFRYAFQEGYLDRYAVVGLHRNYNARNIVEEMAAEGRIHYTFWEDIHLRQRLTFDEAITQALAFASTHPCGIELDLDSLEGVLSSAMSPVGFSSIEARRYLYLAAAGADPAYLHICEGAARLDNGLEDTGLGKLIAYLVTDFLRTLEQGRAVSSP